MAKTQLTAGVDSSTQSVKVVIRNAETGELVRHGRASHPDGTEVDPAHWESALDKAIADAGGLDDVSAISIGGQQHGMVALDSSGEVIRPALLWNDTRSAQSARDLNAEMGGDAQAAQKVGSVLVASFTATKLRWLADNEKANAAKVAAVALPHDWLSWRLQGGKDFDKLFTDRSDASGTGYFDSVSSTYRDDLLKSALRTDRTIITPRITAPSAFGGTTLSGIPIAAGAGDNAGAALGVQAQPGDVVVSLGTSGTAFAVSDTPTHDPSGAVAGFADATGRFLPLVCTLNAARILDAATRILGKTHDEVGALALTAKPGANGLSLLPYFEGERTPNRPDATGVFSGMNLNNSNPADIARAMIEGMLCGLVDAVDALEKLGVSINRVLLIGGAAKNPAISSIASSLFGREVLVPQPGEYVADGAARQAAWALLGGATPPQWNLGEVSSTHSVATPEVVSAYRTLRDRTANW
ncbi:xylulokinase [Candidatus Planktophila dulcis]|uniref:xylulokinase n=1 Tax=Candidatus Planktophila dulcis TaxID=1884914 RepID=UPI000BAC8730|nr:xylulokinase [Candidatus Planktophila dulcis]ASY21117.1 xylulokinase [Candidatus Planktophila dulcis]